MSTQNQSDRENTPCTVDEINNEIEMAEKSRKHFRKIILLNEIVLETEIEVFPWVRLVPFPPSLGKKGTEIPRYVSEWASAGGIDYFLTKHSSSLILLSHLNSTVNNFVKHCL